MTSLTITINGRVYGPRDVRDDLTMNDFLREYLGMTGTKFGCGAAQCLSCAIIVDSADGTSYTSPTCIVPAVSFNGKRIRTVEGHAKAASLPPCKRPLSLTSPSSAAIARRAFSTRARSCSSVWRGRRSRAPTLRRRSPKGWRVTSAAAPVTSNITRRCAM